MVSGVTCTTASIHSSRSLDDSSLELFQTIHDVALMLDRERQGREASPTAGVADSRDAADFTDMISLADVALMQAKADGRNRTIEVASVS